MRDTVLRDALDSKFDYEDQNKGTYPKTLKIKFQVGCFHPAYLPAMPI